MTVRALGQAEELAEPVERELLELGRRGEVLQSMAFTFKAAMRSSARIPGSEPEMAK